MSNKHEQAIRRALAAMDAILTQEECGDITTQCSEGDRAVVELAYAHDELRNILSCNETYVNNRCDVSCAATDSWRPCSEGQPRRGIFLVWTRSN